MKIDEKTFKAMPAELQALFQKLPNPGSDEVVGLFPVTTSGRLGVGHGAGNSFGVGNADKKPRAIGSEYGNDTGSAARFFYQAKCSKADRTEGGKVDNTHPTIKPTDLMRYLCRLVTPPGGVVLDPFMGSGSTGKAAVMEGFRFIGIEREAEYIEIAERRIAVAQEWVSPPEQVALL